jgi:hypothetical protein
VLEKIRTFFGRIIGQHHEKKTVVVEGELWRCTKCHLIFLNKKQGENHTCLECN